MIIYNNVEIELPEGTYWILEEGVVPKPQSCKVPPGTPLMVNHRGKNGWNVQWFDPIAEKWEIFWIYDSEVDKKRSFT